MTTKMPPCCARPRAKLTMDEANLARLAKLAASDQARGRDITRWVAKIEENKAVIVADKIAIDEHDANHAGGGL